MFSGLFLGAAAAVLLTRTPDNVGGLRGFAAKLAVVALIIFAASAGPAAAT